MDKTITNFLDNEFKEYAIHTVYRRAIPSIIDGFKPAQRKAFYTALKVANNKFIKTVSLVGYVFPLTNYHHGDAAMADTIVGMTAPYSNNVPLFLGEGSFGSRLVPVAASPRYTSVKVNPECYKFFVDNELCPNNEDPENPEPKYYLPLIPMVLVNGTKGIATGFATTILPRSVNDIVNACVTYLETGNVPESIVPSFPQFDGSVVWNGSGWDVLGKIIRKTKTKIQITEIPYGLSRTQYVSILQKLEDEGKILRFVDNCSRQGMNFEVILPRDKASSSDEEIMSLLKLKRKVAENYTLIDENLNLKTFGNIGEIIKHFCDFRLGIFSNRYSYYTERDKKELSKLKERLRFIVMVTKGQFKLNGKTSKIIRDELISLGFSKDSIDDFMRLPFSKFTQDEIDKLKDKMKELETNIKKWANIDCRKQFVSELRSLI